MLETVVRYELMKIITIIKSGLKIISATILLIFIPSGLFYSCISSYPSSRVKSQLFNSNTKPEKTLEVKTGKKEILQVKYNLCHFEIPCIYMNIKGKNRTLIKIFLLSLEIKHK